MYHIKERHSSTSLRFMFLSFEPLTSFAQFDVIRIEDTHSIEPFVVDFIVCFNRQKVGIRERRRDGMKLFCATRVPAPLLSLTHTYSRSVNSALQQCGL